MKYHIELNGATIVPSDRMPADRGNSIDALRALAYQAGGDSGYPLDDVGNLLHLASGDVLYLVREDGSRAAQATVDKSIYPFRPKIKLIKNGKVT